MSVTAAYLLPHPPLAVPQVGKGAEVKIKKTIEAYERAAKEIAAFAPELIVFITPHAVLYADYFHISPNTRATGDFSRFGAADTVLELNYDENFTDALSEKAEKNKISAGTLGERDNTLDHGVMVPLYFIQKFYKGFKAARIAVSDLELTAHYELGKIIAETAQEQRKKTLIIASGDMSHKLLPEGPYGFEPEGPKFDAQVKAALKEAKFDIILGISDSYAETAAECGLKSIAVMAGALHKKAVKPQILSYEGVTGVGYLAASFIVWGNDETRDFIEILKKVQLEHIKAEKAHEDKYVSYARYVVETYIKTNKVPDIPQALPQEMFENKAGVFVCIKKNANLRGCVGTIFPAYNNTAEEIRANAISAAVGDSRFLPVTEDELPFLSYSVDILEKPQSVDDINELDVKKYGVVVFNKFKKGLLLPNLEGVNTVEEQLEIAKRKAGIGEREDFSIEKFEVVRHK